MGVHHSLERVSLICQLFRPCTPKCRIGCESPGDSADFGAPVFDQTCAVWRPRRHSHGGYLFSGDGIGLPHRRVLGRSACNVAAWGHMSELMLDDASSKGRCYGSTVQQRKTTVSRRTV